MKVLVVTQYFYPEQFRINDICKALVELGHQVTVVTGLPNYPEGMIYPGYENAWKEESDYCGARVYRCKLRPRYKGAKNLALNYLSFVVEAKKVLKRLEPDFDVIYVYEPSPITAALPAIWYKKKHKIPIYFYCLDIWPECVRDSYSKTKTLSSKHPIYVAAKFISKYVYNHVDVISNKCEEFSEYIAQVCKVSTEKMNVLYEHAEETYLSVNCMPDDNGIVDFAFMGNIGTVQNCDKMVMALKQLKSDKPFKLHFVGDGSELESLKELVTKEHLSDNVVFHGRFPVSEMIGFYNMADVCLLSLSNLTAVGLTPPAKLLGYMAAGRPVLAAINGAAQRIIKDADCGFVVAHDDFGGFAKDMQYILDNPQILSGLGERGRSYFKEHFTLDIHVSNLERNLYKLTGAE